MSIHITIECDQCGYDKPKQIPGWFLSGTWVNVDASEFPVATEIKLRNLNFCSIQCAVDYLIQADKDIIQAGKAQ